MTDLQKGQRYAITLVRAAIQQKNRLHRRREMSKSFGRVYWKLRNFIILVR